MRGATVCALLLVPAAAWAQAVPYQPSAQKPPPPSTQPPPAPSPPPAAYQLPPLPPQQPPPPARQGYAPPPAPQPPPAAYQQPAYPQQPAAVPPSTYPPQPAYPQQPPPAYPQQPGYPPPAPAYQQPGYQPPAPPPPAAYQQPPQEAAEPTAPDPAVATKPARFYEPTPSDSMLPWNDHDPWAGAFKIGVTASTNQFFNGTVKGAGGEVGLRVGNDFIAISGGSFQGKTSATMIGLDFFRGSGNKVLYDALLPDVQAGLTFFGIEAHYVTGSSIKAIRVKVPTLGLRVTIEDFVTIDLKVPTLAIWKSVDKGDDKASPSFSWGGTLDAGITF